MTQQHRGEFYASSASVEREGALPPIYGGRLRLIAIATLLACSATHIPSNPSAIQPEDEFSVRPASVALSRHRTPKPSRHHRTPPSLSRILACIRHYESRGNYRAVSSTGKYRNAYQMNRGFWLRYGGDPALAGDKHDRSTWRWEHASPAEQDAVAARGYQARGLQPWPTPAKRCA